jgi:hypothetical protein
MGAVSFDVLGASRRLETAFPLHTEEGVRSFLDKLSNLEELKYYSGDYDVSIWLVDFYETIRTVGLSDTEMKVIYFLYFEGYRQVDLVGLLNLKKNTINTLLKRAVRKLSEYYLYVRLREGDGYCGTN